MKRFWKDNRGMTLVELMITITILGIVATPLLHGFLTSARTEVKAHEMGEVTAVAQSVMEAVEGNGFEEVVVSRIGGSYDVFESASNNNVSASYYKLGSSYIRHGGNRPTAEDYHIGLKNYKYDGKEYEVMVDIAASGYQQLNDVDEMSVYEVDHVFDVIPEVEVKTYKDIYGASPTHSYIYTGYFTAWYQYMYPWLFNDTPVIPEKTIIVEVEEYLGYYARVSVKCKLEYAYPTDELPGQPEGITPPTYPDFSGGSGYPYLPDPVSFEYEVGSFGFDVRDGEETSVYLLYHPSYAKTGEGYVKAKDTIVIDNTDNVSFNLYIMKEQNAGLSDGELQSIESLYECSVEQDLYYFGNPTGAGAEIYTNLKENLGDPEGAELNVPYVISNWYGSTQGTLNGFRTETEARDRIYEVTVKVFEKSSDFRGEPLGSLTGAILK